MKKRAPVPEDMWNGERFDFLELSDSCLHKHTHIERYRLAQKILKGRILDLGTGAGAGASMLKNCIMIGTDIDENSLTYAKNKYLTTLVRSDAKYLPFKDNVFSGLICFDVIEHISEQERVLAEAGRVLGSTGDFLISTPNSSCLFAKYMKQNKYHKRELTFYESKKLIQKYFKIIEIHSAHLPLEHCPFIGPVLQLYSGYSVLLLKILLLLGKPLKSKARYLTFICKNK